MRYGRKYDKNRVIWLVRFLESWCSKEDLENRVNILIDTLSNGKWDTDVVSLLGEAYLSCNNIGIELKEKLISSSKQVLPLSLTKGMSISDSDLLKTVKEFYSKRDFDNAKKYILKLNDLTSVYSVLANINYQLDEYDEALKYSDLAIKNEVIEGFDYALRGGIKLGLQDEKGAIFEFSKAIELKHFESIIELGKIFIFSNEFEKGKETFKKGLNHKSIRDKSAHHLGHLYEIENNKKKSEKYLKLAIEYGDVNTLICLGELYLDNDEIDKAIEVFEKALDAGIDESYIHLASLYNEKGEFEKGLKFIEKIKKSKDSTLQLAIAKLYHREFDLIEEAKKHFKLALKLGETNAFKGLGILYEENGEINKAEKLYLEIYENTSNDSVLMYLADFYRRNKKNKKEALRIVENVKETQIFNKDDDILYSLILLWNNKLEESVLIMDKILSEFEDEQLDGIIEYFISLMKSKYYDVAYDLILNNDLIDVIKPVYFALMSFMKGRDSNEFLKMGEELKEVVNKIIEDINHN